MKNFLFTTLLTLLAFVAVAHASVTETFSQTCALDAEGSISLNNVNGPVEIVAWDKSEVSIEALKEGSTQAALERIRIKVESTPHQLSISTEHEKSWKFWERFKASVHYTLWVPAGSHLDKINTVNANITVTGVHGLVNLDTINGSIHVTGLRADARLDSINGSLSAEFDTLENVKNVKLESVNGRIEITLPKGAGANLVTRTVNGKTHVDQAIKLENASPLSVSGQIGTGGPSITLETVNGSISVQEK